MAHGYQISMSTESNGHLRVCTICARGGSQGVPGKNIRDLLGKPLIAYTIEQAQASGIFSSIVVSSDDKKILDVAEKWNVDLLVDRPEALATSESAKLPAIQHAVKQAEEHTNTSFDTVVDLDATSPIRTTEDIRAAVNLAETTDAPNVITGVPARRSPYFNLVEKKPDGTVQLAKSPDESIVRRQDVPPCYDMNASIYVWKRSSLFAEDTHPVQNGTKLYEMEEHQAFDIDSEIDFMIVETIINHLNK